MTHARLGDHDATIFTQPVLERCSICGHIPFVIAGGRCWDVLSGFVCRSDRWLPEDPEPCVVQDCTMPEPCEAHARV